VEMALGLDICAKTVKKKETEGKKEDCRTRHNQVISASIHTR
jgi:hypothetical protein